MAYVLTTYQRQERLSDDALSQYLNATPAAMPRLALCKRPASDSPQFADQIRQIADYAGVDAVQLANMVRQVSSLDADRLSRPRSQSGATGRWSRALVHARKRLVASWLVADEEDRGWGRPSQLWAPSACLRTAKRSSTS